MGEKQIRDIFNSKLKKIIVTVNKWPRFVPRDIDMELRSEKWKKRYERKRIIIWNNINVNLNYKPKDTDFQ